jgi:hypothetical protein
VLHPHAACRSKPEVSLAALLQAWPEEPERFEDLSRDVADWPALLAQAQSHGVLPVLAQAWLDHGLCPPAAKPLIEERRALQRVWIKRIIDSLDQILDKFSHEELRVVALKGPVLAERLYGDAQARFSLDIDLLVRPDDFARASAVLEALGYRATEGPSARYHRTHHHHLTFRQPQRPLVELHFRTFTGFGAHLAAADCLARATPYQTGRGTCCFILASEDEFLYLAVHAAGHGCQRWSWLYDLKCLLRRHPALDWQTVFARAEAAYLGVALTFTLDVLQQRLGERPGLARPCAPGDFVCRRRRPAAARLMSWLANRDEESPTSRLGWLVFQALLCDDARRSLWFLQHHLGRIARRRLQSALPQLVPEDWAG